MSDNTTIERRRLHHEDDVAGSTPPGVDNCGVQTTPSSPHVLRPSKTITIVQQNVQGLGNSDTQLDEIRGAMGDIDVLLLQETRRRGTGKIEIYGYNFFMHGAENEERASGVGIVLGPRATRAWKLAGEKDPVTYTPSQASKGKGRKKPVGRMIALELHFIDAYKQKMKLLVISAHLPHSGYSDVDYQACLNKLGEWIENCPKDTIPFIGGDFNARVGTQYRYDKDSIKAHIGRYGIDDVNDRGRMLSHFLMEHDLCIPSTFFEKKEYGTWEAHQSGERHQIDYPIVRKRDHVRVKDCASEHLGIVQKTDHFGVKTTLKFAAKFRREKGIKRMDRTVKKPPQRSKRNTKPDFYTGRETYDDAYKEEVERRFAEAAEECDGPISIESAMDILQQASAAYPEVKKYRDDWYSCDEEELTKARKVKIDAETEYQRNKTKGNRDKARKARRALSDRIKKAKETWIRLTIGEMHGKRENPYESWQAQTKLIAGLTGHHKKNPTSIGKLQTAQGDLTIDDNERANLVSDYFGTTVFGRESPYDKEAVDSLPQKEINEALGNPFTLDELKTAIGKASNRKACGSNGIYVEHFKKLDDPQLHVVLDCVNEYKDNPEYDSEDFHKVRLKLLRKKGDPTVIKNWRPISLLDVCSKLISSMMAARLNKHLQKVGLVNQFGFTPFEGTEGAISSLKILLQNLTAAEREAYVLFVDLVKAFDSVNREMLWKILAKYGVPKPMIDLIEKMYTDINIEVVLGKVTVEFDSTSGVKQGDNLAPILFLFVIQAALDTMNRDWPVERPDMAWCPSVWDPGNQRVVHKGNLTQRSTKASEQAPMDHNSSLYADDAGFVFLSYEDIIEGTKFIKDCFALFGLEVHLGTRGAGPDGKDVKSKTEAMYFPPRSKSKDDLPEHCKAGASFDIGDGRFVSFCEAFKYLGSYLTNRLDEDYDVDARITAATKMFNATIVIFKDKRIARFIKVEAYVALVINTLLYGCDSWALKQCHIQKLAAFHNKCARTLAGINMWQVREHKISTESMLKRLKLMSLEQFIQVRQLRLLQKLAKKPQDRLTRQMLNSQATKNPNVGKLTHGNRATTRRSWKETLQQALNLTKEESGKLDVWMPQMRHPEVHKTIEKNLNLPEGTFHKGPKPRRERPRT